MPAMPDPLDAIRKLTAEQLAAEVETAFSRVNALLRECARREFRVEVEQLATQTVGSEPCTLFTARVYAKIGR